MNYEVLFIAIVVSLLLNIGLSALLSMRRARLARRRTQNGPLLDDLREDVRALCAGAVGLGRRIGELEKRVRRVNERQEQLEQRDHQQRPYDQAIRMVHKGAAVEEIMAMCDISRSEADLIIMMHRLDEAG